MSATVPSPAAVLSGLRRLTDSLGGSPRAGQDALLDGITKAIRSGDHLIGEAGTGTGKSFAYLTPAVLSGKRVLVSTHGKRLQRQLVDTDLPNLRRHLHPNLTFALAKGRSDYLCRTRTDGPLQLRLTDNDIADDIVWLRSWVNDTDSGDRSDLPRSVSDEAWRQVSMGPGDCPGKRACRFGESCFAELARDRSRHADVVVTNHHLLAFHLRFGSVLPEPDLVIIDEAHELEPAVTAALQTSITAGRVASLQRTVEPFVRSGLASRLGTAASTFTDVVPRVDTPVLWDDLPEVVPEHLEEIAAAARRVRDALLSGAGSNESEERAAARKRADNLATDAEAVAAAGPDRVRWAEGGALTSAPLDVSAFLASRLLRPTPVILVSATLRVGGSFEDAERQLGLDRTQTHKRTVRRVTAASPFAYPLSVRYVASDLPHPTREKDAFDSAAIARCVDLIGATGGRCLLLCSTTRARGVFTTALRERLSDFPVLEQGDRPDPLLVKAFRDDPRAVLVATLGFWQGVDVPGPSLSLVIIDRVPFLPPTDPLSSARQQAAGEDGFAKVSVPAAGVLMMQAVGRLIRRESDRGVVAILDPRMGTAVPWAVTIRAGLPPMEPTTDLPRTLTFLRKLDTHARSRGA